MPISVGGIVSDGVSSVTKKVVNDPLVQFYLYQNKPEVISAKNQKLQKETSNYNQWKHLSDIIYYCKQSEYGQLQLSTHFKVSDYCKGSGDSVLLCMKTIQILETVWSYFGRDIAISSGYRDPAFNGRLNSSTGSKHLWGLAVDFKIKGLTAQVVGEFIAHYFHDCEIGVYGHSDMSNSGNWVHVAPSGKFNDYNKRIKGTDEFRKFKSPNSPDEPVIYTDDQIQLGYSNTSSGFGGAGGIVPSIDFSKINPYVVTIDRNTKLDIDYDTLKSNLGIVGVLVEAGYLFSQNHARLDYFRNPNIVKQIDSLKSHNIQHGFYFIARAKTSSEAYDEIYELSFLVRKYPPMLGVWIILDLPNPKDTNNRLIDVYYKELIRLGLIGKIGFYVTQEILESQIDWASFKDDWYLWVVNHVDDLSSLDSLLYPEFFDIDGENPPADWVQTPFNSFGVSVGGGTQTANDQEAALKFINCLKENGASIKDKSQANAKLFAWVCQQYPPAKSYPRAWCAATMLAAARYNGWAGVIFPDNNISADPENGFAPLIYKQYGGKRIDDSNAIQIGDIFQIKTKPGFHRHVGVISGILGDGRVETVEGNNAGVKNRKITDFDFYARPNWSAVTGK